MPGASSGEDIKQARIMLGLLDSVERDGAQSQRHLAGELGIALGLVNAYLKRCVKKGLVKASQAPARRYVYYLTPKGFVEKSRLTVEYFSHSFSFFRRARLDCADVFIAARTRGWNKVLLAGVSDLAEVALICSLESKIVAVGVVDASSTAANFIGLPVFASFGQVPVDYDGVVITDLRSAHETNAAAVACLGPEKVISPALLGLDSRVRRAIV